MASAIEVLLLAAAVPLLREGPTGTWHLDWSQSDLSTNTMGNTTTATALTLAWPVTAGDAATGTVYIVEVPVTGTYETQTLNIGVMLNGTYHNVLPVSSTAFTAGDAFGGIIRARFTVTAAGSGGTVQVDSEASLGDETNPRLPSNSLSGHGHIASLAWNTTVAATLAVAAQWGGTATGQAISGITSTITRKGP